MSDQAAGRHSCGFRSVLVCFAVREEARFFSVANPQPRRVGVLITGMGQQNAARSVEEALRALRPALVLTSGFAGALRPDLPVGTVVYSEAGGTGISKILSARGMTPVRFHCSPRIAVTAVEKRALFSQTGADAVEMESHLIEQICRSRGVPCVIVRVISDGAEEDLPLDFNAVLTNRMSISYPKLMGKLLSSPTKVLELLRFQRQTNLAAKHLGAALEDLLCCEGALLA